MFLSTLLSSLGGRHFAGKKCAKVRYVTLSKPDFDDVGLTNTLNIINKKKAESIRIDSPEQLFWR